MPSNPKFESLDSLLSQALKHARKNRQLQSDLCTLRAHKLVEEQYANPKNWHTAGLVTLIYRDTDGTLSNLGIFEESFYRKTQARRLLPYTGLVDTRVPRTEFVSGTHWIMPKPAPFHQYEETPQELLALQARFEELMEDFTADLEAAGLA